MKKTVVTLWMMLLVFPLFAQEKPQEEQDTLRLSMVEAIEFALENSYETKIADQEIKAARKKKWETTADGLPQLSANIEYQRWIEQQVSLLPAELMGGNPGDFVEVAFGTKQNVNATATLSQLVFDGSYIVGVQSAKTYLKISQLAKRKTELETREAIVNAYGNVLVAKKTLEILNENLRVLRKNLEDTREIYKNGLNEEEDVEQLEITVGNVESQLNSTRRLESIAYGMLKVALGTKLETVVILTETLDSLSVSQIDLQLVVEDFDVRDHIDYKTARNNKQIKQQLVRLEKSKALPRLSAFINAGYMANNDKFRFFKSDQKWFDFALFGATLEIPIFSSLKRSAKTQQAKIDLEIADLQLEQAKRQLELQVFKTKNDYQLSIELFDVAKRNLGLAERIEQKNRTKFFEGLASSFDLFQAQNQLYSQQQEYVQSMLDVIAKKAALEIALNTPLKK